MRQMGLSTTEVLFRIYSRYVSNLTRQDGSVFESRLKRILHKPFAHFRILLIPARYI